TAVAPAHIAADRARVLDLDTAGDRVEVTVASLRQIPTVPEEVELFLDLADRTYLHHQELTVDGRKLEWYVEDDVVHAATVEGLARAVCWRAGAWERRHLLAAVLREPSEAARLLAEADLE